MARETWAKTVAVRDAATAGELIIVPIPEGKIPTLPKDLFAGVSDDAVVVDTAITILSGMGWITSIEYSMTQNRCVATRRGRSIVKASNTINYQRLVELGQPKGSPGRIAPPVASDDRHGKDLVMRLMDELGFDPVDDGGLDDSWRQRPGTPVYDRDAAGARRALAQASPSASRNGAPGRTIEPVLPAGLTQRPKRLESYGGVEPGCAWRPEGIVAGGPPTSVFPADTTAATRKET